MQYSKVCLMVAYACLDFVYLFVFADPPWSRDIMHVYLLIWIVLFCAHVFALGVPVFSEQFVLFLYIFCVCDMSSYCVTDTT